MEKPRSRREEDGTKRNWTYLCSCSPLFHQCLQVFDGDVTDAHKHTHIYTQTYTPHLLLTKPCGSGALFADCYGWSLTAPYGSALSSTTLLCLTPWPLPWGRRVMSFRSSSSSREQPQLGYKMLQSIGAVSFFNSLVNRGPGSLERLTGEEGPSGRILSVFLSFVSRGSGFEMVLLSLLPSCGSY